MVEDDTVDYQVCFGIVFYIYYFTTVGVDAENAFIALFLNNTTCNSQHYSKDQSDEEYHVECQSTRK